MLNDKRFVFILVSEITQPRKIHMVGLIRLGLNYFQCNNYTKPLPFHNYDLVVSEKKSSICDVIDIIIVGLNLNDQQHCANYLVSVKM